MNKTKMKDKKEAGVARKIFRFRPEMLQRWDALLEEKRRANPGRKITEISLLEDLLFNKQILANQMEFSPSVEAFLSSGMQATGATRMEVVQNALFSLALRARESQSGEGNPNKRGSSSSREG